MSIPVANTAITVIRPSLAEESEIDPWEREGGSEPIASSQAVVASKVRAVIAPWTGRGGRTAEPGDTETMEFQLTSDPTDLTFRDKVLDEKTSKIYEVTWAHHNPGVMGINAHTAAGLVTVTGPGNE